MAVVPTTKLQSLTAPWTESNSCASAKTDAAPTAETASRKAFSKGVTRRRSSAPKLLIARAAAPMLSGFRVRTRTTRRFARLAGVTKAQSSYFERRVCHTACGRQATERAESEKQRIRNI